MATLWQTLTGKGNRQDSSGQQLTKEALAEAERLRKEKEAADAAAEEERIRKAKEAIAAKGWKTGGPIKAYAKGGMVRSRDGIASKGKTKGRFI